MGQQQPFRYVMAGHTSLWTFSLADFARDIMWLAANSIFANAQKDGRLRRRKQQRQPADLLSGLGHGATLRWTCYTRRDGRLHRRTPPILCPQQDMAQLFAGVGTGESHMYYEHGRF